MSLRLKLIALFAAVLAATMSVAAWLGGRIAEASIETEIRDRTRETARAFVADLGLSASYDARSTNERLTQMLRSHRGLRAVELAIDLDIPQSIIDKPPSAGLWPGQTDEEEMGFSYSDLERYLSEGPDAVAPALAMRIERLIRSTEHKRAQALMPDLNSDC